MSTINYFAFNSTYTERRRNNHQETTNIKEFIDLINFPGKVYEVLLNTPVKLFIDIDGIPKNKPDLINEFIQEFIKFMKKIFDITINKYALTKNEGSTSHAGLSYHIYFPEYQVKHISIIKYILLNFIKYDEERKFYDYIDGCIYHYNRLFRCPNQYNANKEVIDELDKHIIIQGSIEDCVIQYIDKSTLININCDYSNIKGITMNHMSGPGKNYKLKQEKKKLINKLCKVRNDTDYSTLENYERENNEKTYDESKDKLLIWFVTHERNDDINKLNLDKLTKEDLQKYITKLSWIDDITNKIINEIVSKCNDNIENKEDKEECKTKTKIVKKKEIEIEDGEDNELNYEEADILDEIEDE